MYPRKNRLLRDYVRVDRIMPYCSPHRIFPLVLLSLLAFPQVGRGQPSVFYGRVLGSDHKGVYGASIVNLNTRTHAVSAEDGRFTLMHTRVGDSLLVAHVAYMPYRFRLGSSDSISDIQLSLRTVRIDEVQVKAPPDGFSSHREELGYYSSKSSGCIMDSSPLAVYIPNPRKKPARIEQIRFRLEETRNTSAGMRVFLLSVDQQSQSPGQDTLMRAIQIDCGKLRKRNRVKISDSSVILPPEGGFVVLQCVRSLESGKNGKCACISSTWMRKSLLWQGAKSSSWIRFRSPASSAQGLWYVPRVSLIVRNMKE